MMENRISLKGVLVYPFKSVDELIEKELLEKKVLVAVNAEKVVLSTEQTRDIINRNIGYCDGAGAVKAIKKKGHKNVVRIAGCELWLHIIEKLYRNGTSFYFIGSKQEVIEETIAKLKNEFPNLNIAGYRNGFIKDDNERSALIQEIATKKPDVVFVAMGSPKQEILMEDIRALHPAIYQGLGGSFDVYTGHVKRAPKWWQKNKLEWAYRFYAKPSRIGRLKNYIKFLLQMELGKI